MSNFEEYTVVFRWNKDKCYGCASEACPGMPIVGLLRRICWKGILLYLSETKFDPLYCNTQYYLGKLIALTRFEIISSITTQHLAI